jgi:hypothetical protein
MKEKKSSAERPLKWSFLATSFEGLNSSGGDGSDDPILGQDCGGGDVGHGVDSETDFSEVGFGCGVDAAYDFDQPTAFG